MRTQKLETERITSRNRITEHDVQMSLNMATPKFLSRVGFHPLQKLGISYSRVKLEKLAVESAKLGSVGRIVAPPKMFECGRIFFRTDLKTVS
jgi:hypothetical protein